MPKGRIRYHIGGTFHFGNVYRYLSGLSQYTVGYPRVVNTSHCECRASYIRLSRPLFACHRSVLTREQLCQKTQPVQGRNDSKRRSYPKRIIIKAQSFTTVPQYSSSSLNILSADLFEPKTFRQRYENIISKLV